MKKKDIKILLYWLLLVLIVASVLWLEKFWEANAPINIGHPKKGDFIKVGKMSEPRYNHQTILLDDGTVLVFGGMTLRRNYEGGSYTADIYNPKTRKFTPVGNMNERRKDFAVTKLNNGKILITGGYVANLYSKSTELYNPATKRFEKGPDLRMPRSSHTTTLLDNGQVLITGGGFCFANESEIYNPKADKFNISSKMNISRFSHSAILLKDGRVLIIGGIGKNNEKSHKLASAEIYDPKINKFTLAGNMNIARKNANLYLLKDGNVLISGGIKDQDKDKGMDSIYVREIELYNPKTNKFEIIAKRTSAANEPAEVLLNDGKLLFVGSQTGVGLSLMWYKTSEIFDPKTRQFTQGKDMNYARSCHRMTLLRDGNVLITGSYNEGRTAELYISK